MAAGLVKAYEGHWFVYLHLLCQGLECIWKALLLAHDYEKYEPILRTDFGHDLEVLVTEVDRNFSFQFFSNESLKELKPLNSYYKRHILRYGNAEDFRKDLLQLAADHLHGDLVDRLTEFNEHFFTEKGET
jgi:thymidine kinase